MHLPERRGEGSENVSYSEEGVALSSKERSIWVSVKEP